MSIADVRVVPVTGDPTRLEPLARAVFGEGQRAPGWFARKLGRECVVPERSMLATRSADASDPRAWVGYGLLGQPPSLAPIARTAGIGLIPGWRGRGLGRRIVLALLESARDAGSRGVIVPASSTSAPFYARCGLRPSARTLTLLAFGRGRSHPSAVEDWDGATPGPQRSGWFPEAWQRSPHRATMRVRDGRDRFDVSMEGSACVAMRWTSLDGHPDGPEAWLERIPRGSPALLHEAPADAAWLTNLEKRGWTVVQTTIAMQHAWAADSHSTHG